MNPIKNTKYKIQKTLKKMKKHYERQIKERDLFRDILEVQARSAKLNFWEEDEEESQISEDIYSRTALLSEDDDVDPITAGVMLGFITA